MGPIPQGDAPRRCFTAVEHPESSGDSGAGVYNGAVLRAAQNTLEDWLQMNKAVFGAQSG
jgi:hypothetical protein